MKKAIVLIALCTSLLLPSITTQAKTIMVPDKKITTEFLKKHKGDTVYSYFYGKVIDNKGNGKVTKYGIKNSYVRYKGERKGARFLTVLKFRKGTRKIDAIVKRIDIEIPQKELKETTFLYK